MPFSDPPRLSREEALRRAEDATDERAQRDARAERIAEHASLLAWDPAVHRLARRERARRDGLTGGQGRAA